MHLRMTHGVPVASYEELFLVPVAELDSIARQTVRGAMKMAGAEGAGLGLGGFSTVVPDMGILSAITLRMVQKLSLIYGFEFNTDEEIAELWIAAATAAGARPHQGRAGEDRAEDLCGARDWPDGRALQR